MNWVKRKTEDVGMKQFEVGENVDEVDLLYSEHQELEATVKVRFHYHIQAQFDYLQTI